MPYIKSEDRERAGTAPENPGELNYAITILVNDYLSRKGLKYSNINDVLGALEGAKFEFYRRVAANYETKKQSENGDVYS